MKKIILSFCQAFIFCIVIGQTPIMVKDIFPGFSGSGIQQIVRSSNYTFFNAEDDDPDTDRGLYRTDGTGAGTIKLNLTFPGYVSTKAEKLTVLGDKVVFAVDNSNSYGEVWVSDGTQVNTIPLERFIPANYSTKLSRRIVMDICQLNNEVLYAAKNNSDHLVLKKTDGTAAGITIVKDFGIFSSLDASFGLFRTINGILYFNLYDGIKDQLWRSDGTNAGTYMLKDFGADQYVASSYMPAGGFFYWMIVKDGIGNVLWKSDGSVGGTGELKIMGNSGNNNYPQNVAIGDTLYFTGLDANGMELWKTDGSATGTMMVADINTGSGNSNPAALAVLDSVIYFSAFSAATGNELWKYDRGNVSLVKDIYPGAASGNPTGLAVSNSVILFSAVNDASGTQLWITDGSEANTLRAAEINSSGAAAPALITAGNPVYFIADDGINGSELFSYDNSKGINSFLLKAGAMDFDGINDFAHGTNTDLPQSNANRTMEAWINPAGTQYGTIFNYGTAVTNQRSGLHYIGQKLFFISEGYTLQGNTIIPTGTWTHVAVTYNNNTLRMYVNGVLDGVSNKVLGTSGFDFRIGSSVGNLNEFFNGKIDEVRIWDHSLSACEIINDMRCELRGTETGLVGYYNFNQGDAKRTNVNENILFEHNNNSKNAQLFGFAFTGFRSNWVFPGAVANDVSCNKMNVYIYDNVKSSYICQGDTASFIAKPTRQGANVSFQWSKNDIDIPNATDSIYSLLSVGVSDTIRCRMTQVTNCGTLVFNSNTEILHGVYPSYTFTGNGAWEESSNWVNNTVPPKILPSCSEIFINPVVGGQCTLNGYQLIDDGAKLTVYPGAKLNIINDLNLNDSSYVNILDTMKYPMGLALPTPSELSQIAIFQASDTSLIETEETGIEGRTMSGGAVILKMPRPGNQGKLGQYNSCAAWAIGYGLMGHYLNVQEKNLNFTEDDKRVSPTFIWNRLNQHDSLRGLTLWDAMKRVKEDGICKWADMPGNIPYNQPVSLIAEKNAKNYINESLRYELLPTIDITLIKALLRRGRPIVFGLKVDFGLYYNSKRSVVKTASGKIYTKQYGDSIGDHAMVICGYDDQLKAFKVMNSWGNIWGDDGFIWINYEVFKEIVINLTKKWIDGKYYSSSPYIMVTYKKSPKVTMSLTIPTCQNLGNKALVNCNVISLDDNPIKERGICYSKKINPTTSTVFAPNFTRVKGSGTGIFSDTMVNLEYDVKYYVRAYAKTRLGISYGNEDSVIVRRTSSSKPHTITKVSGDSLSGYALRWMKDSMVVIVKNINGQPVANALVEWSRAWISQGILKHQFTYTDSSGRTSNFLKMQNGTVDWGYYGIVARVKSNECNFIEDIVFRAFFVKGITVAGGTAGSGANQLNNPQDVTVAADSSVFVADYLNDRIQKWAPRSLSGTTVAAKYFNGIQDYDFASPRGLCLAGNSLKVSCIMSVSKIRRVKEGSTVTDSAIGGRYYSNTGPYLRGARGIFQTSSGDMYIAEDFGHCVTKWVPGSQTGVLVAGHPNNINRGNEIPGSQANMLDTPLDVFVDDYGNVYVADANNHRIQKWAPGATIGVTVAGGNGPGAAEDQLNFPTAVHVDINGNIYVADYNNNRVQKWIPGTVSGITVAGMVYPASEAEGLRHPTGLYLRYGFIYVADSGNHRVSKWPIEVD